MKQLPGTTLEITSIDCRKVFDSLFSAGGLILSQVCTITGVESHTVQNWVKRKFVSPPKDKKYSKNQLCRIITINMLKETLSLDVICSLISYINGVLENDSGDLIDDSMLYFYFVDLIILNKNNTKNLDESLKLVLKEYKEPVLGTSKRLNEVLKIMYTAYLSAEYKKEALLLVKISEIN